MASENTDSRQGGEGRKTLLEQAYINLLEQRVAQLSKVVAKKDAEPEAESSKEKPDGEATSPLTAENLKKLANGKSTDASATAEEERIKKVINKYNEKRGTREDIDAGQAEAENKAGERVSYLRNVMDSSDASKIAYNEVEIAGPLLALVRETLNGEDATYTWTGKRVTLFSPFRILVFNWDKLEAAQGADESDALDRKLARIDLAKLLQYVRTSDDLNDYFKTRESHRNSNIIDYKYLWTIFAPGTEVVATTFLAENQVLTIDRTPLADTEEERTPIGCWYYDHDGHDWFPGKVEFSVDLFDGTKSIDSLPCYPLKYYKDEASRANLVQELVDRGQKFWDFSKVPRGLKQMFDYDGQLLSVDRPFNQYAEDRGDDQSSRSSSDRPSKKVNISKRASADGRIIIDPDAFMEHGFYGLFVGDLQVDMLAVVERRYHVPLKKKFLLAPPRALGWSTRGKSWCQFAVNRISKAKMANKNVFAQELQLAAPHKRMIRALIKFHNNDEKISAVSPDLIEGKGRGLVIMLHGPPGVGKTLTAEAIAEETERPLLVVSVAEIGLNASRAEEKLNRLFHLASRWEAVLLVDEADVFLESRVREADPNRNALVSVLLRVLEYYKGIMILTTNRIRSLDIAIQSRIHLAIRYDDLDPEQMKGILVTILKKYSLAGHNMTGIIDTFEEYVDEHSLRLNGRQIRNLVFSAQAIAMADGGNSITRDHFKQVLRVTKDFQKQLDQMVSEERMRREVTSDGK